MQASSWFLGSASRVLGDRGGALWSFLGLEFDHLGVPGQCLGVDFGDFRVPRKASGTEICDFATQHFIFRKNRKRRQLETARKKHSAANIRGLGPSSSILGTKTIEGETKQSRTQVQKRRTPVRKIQPGFFETVFDGCLNNKVCLRGAIRIGLSGGSSFWKAIGG